MKRHIHSTCFFLIFLLFSCGSLIAQEHSFSLVPPPPGSPPWGFITEIKQDRSGFMWFATSGYGVQRFDGYKFTSFINEPHNPNSLAKNNTECIFEDSKGIIWIGTTGSGLERLDPVTGEFTHFVHNPNDSESLIHNDVKSIFEDHEGVFWIGTRGGLDRFDRESLKFEHFNFDENDTSTISDNSVKMIYEDSDNTLWFGTGESWDANYLNTNGGLNRFNRGTEKFTRYMHDSTDVNSLIDNRVKAIMEDSRGNFWIGTAGDGLHLMDREKGTFKRLSFDPENPGQLSRPKVVPEPRPGAHDHITFISEDLAGSIWIGTMGAGVIQYDPITKKMTHYGSGDGKGGMNDHQIWSGYVSKEGVVWLGSLYDNLYRADPLLTEVVDLNINTSVMRLYQDDPNVMWMGPMDSGLIRNDLKTGIQTTFENDSLISSTISQGEIRSMVADTLGDFWIGTWGGGLNHYDAYSQSFQHFVHSEKDVRSLDNDSINVLLKDKSSNLWVGTVIGLNMLDRNTGQFKHYHHKPSDPKSLNVSFGISALMEDDSGDYLWVGTHGGGLNRLNRESGQFDHYLTSHRIGNIIKDLDGIIWVGSGEGLYRFSAETNDFVKYVDPHGFINFNSYAVQVDNENNLWLTSSRGIVQITEDRSEIREYSKRDGVKSVNFFRGGIFKGLDGGMYFPYYPHGVFKIFPDRLPKKVKVPIILIQDFKLENQSVIPGEGGPLDVPINDEQEINLSHDQNIFSLDLAAINYANPEDNRVIFMLENYDKDWRVQGVEKTVQYFNLRPGKYTLRIKAATNMGAYVHKEIVINISSPWWSTWWAYGLYCILFIAGVFAVHRFQKTRLMKVEREKTRKKELAQAKEIEKAYTELKATQSQLIQSEKMASLGELTAGIAHEIQNPLNFVNNFSEVSTELLDEMMDELKSGNKEEVLTLASDIKANQEKINHHGKRAGSIVKGMLQHSRTSSGKNEPTDINALCDEYLRLSYHGLRAKNKSFNADFKADLDKKLPQIEVVPQDFGRVLLNLINNAFFAVNERSKTEGKDFKPSVIVKTKLESNKVIISVSDNGSGIPDDVKEKIFQPFFTTKPTGEGTGLGLSLSYDIVKAHGGELKVETVEGEGTEFIIILPI